MRMSGLSRISDWIRRIKNTTCSAVVVAAGSSERMGEDKLLMKLGPLPVLVRTLKALDDCKCVDELILVVREDRLQEMADLCREYGIHKIAKVVKGGRSRTESALAGVLQVRRGARLVLIHDGARPLVTEEIVWGAVHGAALYHCAAPAIPVTDTVKEAEDGVVTRTLDRDSLAAIQTPQVFDAEIIKAALTAAVRDGKEYTDDCAAAEAIGAPIHLTKGSPENIKITRPVDIPVAMSILESRRRGA